jgi:exodeoxyribonuclease VII large subunit
VQAGQQRGAHTRLMHLAARLHRHSPGPRLRALEQRRRHLAQLLRGATLRALGSADERLRYLAQTLHALSPLATLDRGYAIVRRPDSGVVVRDAKMVRAGERVRTQLAHGQLDCLVEKTRAG